MRAQFIYEKFKEDSDPIRDMSITAFPEGFEPLYIVKKNFPGLNFPLGTVFGYREGWSTFAAAFFDEKQKRMRIIHHTGWDKNYFEPFIGEFFERYK